MLISVIRTVILYILILFAVRMMGKRQISEMQTSELVITLLMSNIATIPMQDNEQSMLSGAVPIMVLLVSEIALSYLMLRKSGIRKLICGKPVIVIYGGKPDQKAMVRLRLSTEDLLEQLRQKDIFDINDVAYAIMETNGQLSVMKKSGKEPLTSDDMGIKKQPSSLPLTVISDGETAVSSLELCGSNKKKLEKIIRKEGIGIKDVFLMTMDENGKYSIIKKEEKN